MLRPAPTTAHLQVKKQLQSLPSGDTFLNNVSKRDSIISAPTGDQNNVGGAPPQ